MCSNPVFINIILSLGIVISLAIALIFFCVFIPRPKQQSFSVVEDQPAAIEEDLLIIPDDPEELDRELTKAMVRLCLPHQAFLREMAARKLKEIRVKKSREDQQRRMRFRKARKWP